MKYLYILVALGIGLYLFRDQFFSQMKPQNKQAVEYPSSPVIIANGRSNGDQRRTPGINPAVIPKTGKSYPVLNTSPGWAIGGSRSIKPRTGRSTKVNPNPTML